MGVQRLPLPLLLLVGVTSCLPHPTRVKWVVSETQVKCQCVPQLCPKPTGCLAGLVRDRCNCCLECGNVEGQTCDLDGSGAFRGRCGENLRCQLDMGDLQRGEVPQPECVCRAQRAICGSNRRTYANICAFKAAAHGGGARNLSVAGGGPCQAAPEIKIPPRDLVNVSGQDVIFLCEVVAYPMALVEWRNEGHNVTLPGDDPHISVQSRGGPLKYELSSWLQIEGVTMEDAGTYRCIAHNRLGRATAHAQLHVTAKGAESPPAPDGPSLHTQEDLSSENEDYEDYY